MAAIGAPAAAAAASAVAAAPVAKGLELSMVVPKVTELVKSVLVDDEDVSLEVPFMEAGIDSLGSVQLITDVSREFKMQLSPSAVFDYPTVQSLAEHLVAESKS